MNKPKISGRLAVWLLALLPTLAVAALYSRLPAQIAMQWDFGGKVGYEPKWHLFLITGMTLVMAAIFPALAKIDPRRRNYDKFSGSYLTFQIVMMAFMNAVVGIVLVEALRPGTMRVGRLMCLLVALLLVVIGNMMPRFRQNYFCGIKTPWTYADETVWTRTHRLAGRMFFVAGLIGMAASFVPDDRLMAAGFFAPLILAACVPSLMSYVWYRRLHPAGE